MVRPSPPRRVVAGLAAVLALAMGAMASTRADARSEYLQAARITIEPARITLQLALTPGAWVVEPLIAEIDRNQNGALDPDETTAYAAAVLADLHLEVDERPVTLSLSRQQFPAVEEMRQGESTIGLIVNADLPPLAPGTHRLRFRNMHHADTGVYQTNALAPFGLRVSLLNQERDADQREFVAEYQLRRTGEPPAWLVKDIGVGVLIIALFFIARWVVNRRISAGEA
jgi:hypothetical protein